MAIILEAELEMRILDKTTSERESWREQGEQGMEVEKAKQRLWFQAVSHSLPDPSGDL